MRDNSGCGSEDASGDDQLRAFEGHGPEERSQGAQGASRSREATETRRFIEVEEGKVTAGYRTGAALSRPSTGRVWHEHDGTAGGRANE